MRKRRNLSARTARRAIIDHLLAGDVSRCYLKTGRSKVVYPTEALAQEAARRLNKLRSTHHPGAPYLCERGGHWHLRSARPEDDED